MSILDVISTPLREGRRLLALHALLDRLFQSTPLRDGRRPPRRRNRRRRLFQSTPLRDGRHQSKPINYLTANVSIHPPP